MNFVSIKLLKPLLLPTLPENYWMSTKIKYKRDEKGGFFRTLNSRVDDYFSSNNLSKKTNTLGKVKAILFLLIVLSLVAVILTANGNVALVLGTFAVLGFFQICLALILGHEGVHESFSHSKAVNKLVSYAFDLIGTSGYMWGIRHVHSHHPYASIPEMDVDIPDTDLVTFLPKENPRKSIKYQFLYVPFLYLFYTLSVVFKRDISDFLSKQIGHLKVQHSKRNIIEVIIAKIVYFSYTLVLPILFSGVYWGWVLLGFVLMHFVASLTAAVALFPAHNHINSKFPKPNENGEMEMTWAEHQMYVTMDFGTRWKIVGFFFGGINYHAVHHLFPGICHIHFHSIQKILRETCKEFGIEHREEPYLYKALLSHVRFLKTNGVSKSEMAHLNEVM